MTIKRYYLKIYDKTLGYFDVKTDEIGFREVGKLEVVKGLEYLLPIGIEKYGVSGWLKGRVVPKNRAYVDNLLETIGSPDHYMSIIDVSLGLSVTDSYWVVPEGFKGGFREYNLFENEFDKALSLAAFGGAVSTIRGISTSPEFTTNGMLKKCWRRVDGDVLLYKGGTEGYANTGLEPYSEYYASQIAKHMGIEAIGYDLKKFKGEVVSVCGLFTDIDHSYVPMGYVYSGENIYELVEKYGRENFADMVVFDALICNTDRHRGNFGFIRENKSGKIVRTAPLFDNGMSLFNYAMKSDFEDIDTYAKTRPSAFDADPIRLAKAFMGKRQRNMLRSLIGFRFERHKNYNLPAWRLKAIEGFIARRIEVLLSK